MTYSIVARCPRSGRLGVGVQSHYLAVASIVSWVRAGVGAVATQSEGLRKYGAKGLDLLSCGVSPVEALARLVAEDPEAPTRQVAVVDHTGRTAAHTGSRCIAEAGVVVGDGVVFQANMMRNPGVPEAMASSWDANADLELEERILQTLEAAEAHGGDVRGRQAAGLRVVDAVDAEVWWEGERYDLRVDDHPQPLEELRRLLNLRRAYEALESDDFAEARRLAPDWIEAKFWSAVASANDGRIEEAKAELAHCVAHHDGWAVLLRRLPAAGYLDIDRLAEVDR